MKTAIITGGDKGLGIAQTRRFLEEGYRVYVVARSRSELDRLTGDVHFVEADLCQSISFLDTVHAEAGSIDVLVNNSGMHLKNRCGTCPQKNSTAWSVEREGGIPGLRSLY